MKTFAWIHPKMKNTSIFLMSSFQKMFTYYTICKQTQAQRTVILTSEVPRLKFLGNTAFPFMWKVKFDRQSALTPPHHPHTSWLLNAEPCCEDWGAHTCTCSISCLWKRWRLQVKRQAGHRGSDPFVKSELQGE